MRNRVGSALANRASARVLDHAFALRIHMPLGSVRHDEVSLGHTCSIAHPPALAAVALLITSPVVMPQRRDGARSGDAGQCYYARDPLSLV